MNTFQKAQPLNIKLYFFVFSILLSTSYVMTATFLFDNPVTKAAIKNADKKTIERQTVIKDFVNHSGSMLESVNKSPVFKDYLADLDNKNTIQNVFKLIADGTNNLMQIRFIDQHGKEAIRVDRSIDGQSILLVPDHLLQDKSNRYYFQKCKTSEANTVWFSALDLNIERGQVELPYKPTLRSVMPVEQNGLFAGCLVINYYMENFINKLLNMPLYESILVNDQGNILVHYNKDYSWSEYRTHPFTLEDEFPTLGKHVLEPSDGENEEFFYRKLDIPIENGLGLILKLNRVFVDQQTKNTTHQAITTFVLIFIFSAVFGHLLTTRFQNYLSRINAIVDSLSETSKVAHVGFWEYVDGEEYFSWSDGTYDIFEIEDYSTPINYQTFLSYLPTNEQVSFDKAFKDSIKRKSKYHIVHKIKTAKGNMRYLEERARHYYDDEGSYIKSLGSIYDITEQMQKDKVLKSQKRELQTIFDTALEAIGLIDKNANYLKVNRKYTELLGYTEEELLNASCLEMTHPDNFEEAQKIINQVFASGSYENYERKCLNKAGETKIFNSSYSLMPDGQSILITTEDFTDLRSAEQDIIANSYIDELTKIKNRKAFRERSEELFSIFKRYKQSFSFILFDVDDFKAINDTFGHQYGDEILVNISQQVSGAIRCADSVYRIGGEEFVILAPETNKTEAFTLAEKVRVNINENINTPSGNVSISAGVTQVQDTDKSIEDIFSRADLKMYEAKKLGKNMTCS